MKKLLAFVGIGIFGYGCMFIGRVYQTINIGLICYRASEGDEDAIKLIEDLAETASEFKQIYDALKEKNRK